MRKSGERNERLEGTSMNDMSVAPRQAFYDEIGAHSLAPLWEGLHSLVTRAPATPALAALWDYDAVLRPYLMQAGAPITAKEAARRAPIPETAAKHGQPPTPH